MDNAYELAKSRIKGRLDGHFQHEGVRWMLGRELACGGGGVLADDMGLGKTMQMITTMRGNEVSTLIVSIVGTVNQWRDALIDFGGYRPMIINPSFSGILPEGVEVAITTYSAFQKKNPPPCLSNYAWQRIVLDEGHAIRNPQTKVYKEISQIHGARFKWILSGTPIQNSSKDLQTLARWVGFDGNMEEFVKDYVLRRTQEEQAQKNPRLALPPLTTEVIKLDFDSTEERKFYNAVEEHYMDNMMTSFDAIESLTRCRQVCTNPWIYEEAHGGSASKKQKKRKIGPRILDYWEDDGNITSTKMKYLVNAIKDHVNAKKTNKCLVFCIWTAEMKYLQKDLKNIGVSSLIYDGHLSRDNKESVLYNFKHTTIPVLIIQITCGSSGLNLQCANKVFITSPHWNPCIELQAIGRAYRKGQTDCVSCVRLIMNGTVEEKCMEIQDKKMGMISEAMNDDSLLQRLGGTHDLVDDDDIKSIFGKKRNSSQVVVEEEDDEDLEKFLDELLFS